MTPTYLMIEQVLNPQRQTANLPKTRDLGLPKFLSVGLPSKGKSNGN
jgi:hypothetical protein